MLLRPLNRHLILKSLRIYSITSHDRWPTSIRNQSTNAAASSISSYLPSFTFVNEMFADLSRSTAVAKVQQLLETVHDTTHLPWWATIVITTVGLRMSITLPLAAYQHSIFARLENLRPEMDEILKELKKETDFAVRKFKWGEKKAKVAFHNSAKKQWNLLVQRDNCHRGKATVVLWGQLPLWVCMSVALRNMAMMMPQQTLDAQMLFLALSSGGFGWIPNLTDVDHSLILPVFMALSNLAIIEINVLSGNAAKVTPKFVKYLTNGLRGLCVVMVPIAASVPADVVLYWSVSSFYGLAQNLVLMSPRARRLLRIPWTPAEKVTPYRDIINRIKDKKMFKTDSLR